MKTNYKVLSSQGVVYTVEKTVTKFWGYKTEIETLSLYIVPSQHDSTRITRAIDTKTGQILDLSRPELHNAFRAFTLSKKLQEGPCKIEYKILHVDGRMCRAEKLAEYPYGHTETSTLQLYMCDRRVPLGEFVTAIDTATNKVIQGSDGLDALRVAYRNHVLNSTQKQ